MTKLRGVELKSSRVEDARRREVKRGDKFQRGSVAVSSARCDTEAERTMNGSADKKLRWRGKGNDRSERTAFPSLGREYLSTAERETSERKTDVQRE